MLPVLPRQLDRLAQCFARLPGVGQKTALRFSMHLLLSDSVMAEELGRELLALHERIGQCSRCGNVAERVGDGPMLCSVCADTKRDATLVCVVAKVQDLLAIERSGAMPGRYFVLGKLMSPLDGIRPSDIPVDRLRELISSQGVQEVLLATPSTVDGEATALYVAQELADLDVRVSRLASGIPHGGDLEFADQITLGRAIDHRRRVE